MSKGKGHIPTRTCISCRAKRPKKEMVRLVRAADGKVTVDIEGTGEGRGAYVCRNGACLTSLRMDRRVKRAFRTEGPVWMSGRDPGGRGPVQGTRAAIRE